MFEGLLPAEHNENLLNLLFHLGHWHALAKLKLHTETTLGVMDEVTIALGQSLCEFQEKTCSAYDTRELWREADARKKRQAKAAVTSSATPTENNWVPSDTPTIEVTASANGEEEPLDKNSLNNLEESTLPGPSSTTKKRKCATQPSEGNPPPDKEPAVEISDQLARLKRPLNLNTYKNHSLGDYTEAIWRYGTTDSCSTESVCKLLLFHRHYCTYTI